MKAKAIIWFIIFGVGWVGGLIAGYFLAEYLLRLDLYGY